MCDRGDTEEDLDLAVNTENTQLLEESQQDRIEEDVFAERSVFRKPSPWWIWLLIFIVGAAVAATLAPLLDIYTALVCEEIKPEFISSVFNASRSNSSLWAKIPIPSKECRSDPKVQEDVAALVTAMEISMAVLSCLTMGYWMQLSDRYGRVKVLLIAEFGLVANQVVILLVSLFPHKLPGGYRFYLFAQIFEGLLGGRPLVTAILSVYVTDTSASHSRTTNLAITAGLGMLGNSLGPSLGAFLIKQNNDLLAVYDFAIKALIVLTLITVFFVPESLSSVKLEEAQRTFASTHISPIPTSSSAVGLRSTKGVKANFKRLLRLALLPLEPLEVFLPYKKDAETISSSKDTKDYSLFLIGCICFVQTLADNYNKYIFQYVQRMLGWDSQNSSIWLGYNEAASATFLVIILPLVMRWLKPKFITTSSHRPTPNLAVSLNRPIRLDYLLLLVSECIIAMDMLVLGLIRSSGGWYTVTLLKNLGLGYDSSLKSLALSLHARRTRQESESGKLLGGLSVLAILSGSVIGPAIFGSLYIGTVERFPQAIFFLSSFLCLVATLLVLRLRVKDNIDSVLAN